MLTDIVSLQDLLLKLREGQRFRLSIEVSGTSAVFALSDTLSGMTPERTLELVEVERMSSKEFRETMRPIVDSITPNPWS